FLPVSDNFGAAPPKIVWIERKRGAQEPPSETRDLSKEVVTIRRVIDLIDWENKEVQKGGATSSAPPPTAISSASYCFIRQHPANAIEILLQSQHHEPGRSTVVIEDAFCLGSRRVKLPLDFKALASLDLELLDADGRDIYATTEEGPFLKEIEARKWYKLNA